MQGNAVAQYNLAFCYESGQGVELDCVEAVKWYRKAAEQGSAINQFTLGLHYAFGKGVEQDFSEAVKWYREAAEQNLAVSQATLGEYYLKGQGVEKDNDEALKWFKKAAKQGNSNAKIQIGLIRSKNHEDFFTLTLSEIIYRAESRMAQRGMTDWNGYKEYIKQNGRGIINNDTEADSYLAAYGFSHKMKLDYLFDSYLNRVNLDNEYYEVFDYGCGQGLASISFIEHLTPKQLRGLKKITLMDMSPFILKRARCYVRNVYETIRAKWQMDEDVWCDIDIVETSLPTMQFPSFDHPFMELPQCTVVHLFSNILDINVVNRKELARILNCSSYTLMGATHYVLATHPGTDSVDPHGEKMKEFFSHLPNGEVNDTNEGYTDEGVKWSHIIGYASWIDEQEPD